MEKAKKGIEASKKKDKKPYNPYGENATANPTNMSGSSGP